MSGPSGNTRVAIYRACRSGSTSQNSRVEIDSADARSPLEKGLDFLDLKSYRLGLKRVYRLNGLKRLKS